jgi:Domain of unknown function (DUF6089)
MRRASCSFSALLASLWLAGSVFFSSTVLAQSTSEVGIGLGGMNYRGEVSPSYRFLNNRPAGTAFYRKDLSDALTVRAALTLGGLAATDENVRRAGDVVPVAANRQATFRAFLTEVMIGGEYNFLDYYDQKRRTRWTPYVFAGLAGYYASTHTAYRVAGSIARPFMQEVDATKLSISIPIGMGIKYALSRELNLGIEVGGRRTFGDGFDNIEKPEPPQYAQTGDPDWYFYNGISLSYTFYKILCPAGHPGGR